MALSQGLMQEFSLDLLSLHFFFPALRVVSCSTAPSSKLQPPQGFGGEPGQIHMLNTCSPWVHRDFPLLQRQRQAELQCFLY